MGFMLRQFFSGKLCNSITLILFLIILNLYMIHVYNFWIQINKIIMYQGSLMSSMLINLGDIIMNDNQVSTSIVVNVV